MTVPLAPLDADAVGPRGGGDRRTRIIALLRDAQEPLSVADVAERVGIHVNTARFHLESLVYASLATRQVEARIGPGRPRVVYASTLPDQEREQPRGFAQLAQILTAAVAETNPDASRWLYSVGLEWGRFLAPRSQPFAVVDEAETASRLVALLDELGFASELAPGPDGQGRLLLHHCPFAQVARQHPGVPCQLHAGLVNGSLAEMRSGYRLTALAPHETHECVGVLGPAPDEAPTSVPLQADVDEHRG